MAVHSYGLLVTILAVCQQCSSWMTQYDQHFTITCPAGKTFKSIESIQDNYYEDRVWNFNCDVPPNGVNFTSCTWSGYRNEFDKPLDFQCGNDGIITGVESVNDNYYEDRKWSFQCCTATGYVVHACEDTSFVNAYDQPLNYRVPDGKVLRGVHSVHDNYYDDRIYKFNICKLDPVDQTVHVVIG
ncbi:unnamed protein product [Lymnaea stagnalis]|uniref:Dermatopontin n=1 Tax=Lymnaea stagnalis TaxID=6523 RepID=A0AAV2IKG5_LYMST